MPMAVERNRTRKRKVTDGTSVADPQSPAETTTSGSSTPEGVEFVAETPLEDDPALAMQVEDASATPHLPEAAPDSGSRPSGRVPEAAPGSGTTPTAPIGNAPPRSPDEAVGETSAGVAGVEQVAAMPPHGNQPARNNAAMAAPRRSNPYGSWMIVTRNDRRQSGRQSGNGKHTDTGGRAPTSGGANRASGSRYAPLEEEEVTEDPQAPEQPARRADKQPVVSGSDAARHRNRSRRANVVVNEKQIENDRSTHQPTATAITEPVSQRRMAGLGPRRAAEEDEHVVIRGEQGGQVIHSTRVANGEAPVTTSIGPDNSSPEHHSDPPDGFDLEGDVVMEIENPADENLMEVVSHLPRIASDHTPLLIRVTARPSCVMPALFKVQAAWFTHVGLPKTTVPPDELAPLVHADLSASDGATGHPFGGVG
nr:uncharacterized protein LOC109193892 [Ipomoea trifida]